MNSTKKRISQGNEAQSEFNKEVRIRILNGGRKSVIGRETAREKDYSINLHYWNKIDVLEIGLNFCSEKEVIVTIRDALG